MEKLTLSVTEAAKVLGVSRPTMYTIIHRADFPAFHVGNRVLISRQGLADWVEAQTGQKKTTSGGANSESGTLKP